MTFKVETRCPGLTAPFEHNGAQEVRPGDPVDGDAAARARLLRHHLFRRSAYVIPQGRPVGLLPPDVRPLEQRHHVVPVDAEKGCQVNRIGLHCAPPVWSRRRCVHTCGGRVAMSTRYSWELGGLCTCARVRSETDMRLSLSTVRLPALASGEGDHVVLLDERGQERLAAQRLVALDPFVL